MSSLTMLVFLNIKLYRLLFFLENFTNDIRVITALSGGDADNKIRESDNEGGVVHRQFVGFLECLHFWAQFDCLFLVEGPDFPEA